MAGVLHIITLQTYSVLLYLIDVNSYTLMDLEHETAIFPHIFHECRKDMKHLLENCTSKAMAPCFISKAPILRLVHTGRKQTRKRRRFDGFLVFLLYYSHWAKVKANVNAKGTSLMKKATSLMNGYMTHSKRRRFRVRVWPMWTSPQDSSLHPRYIPEQNTVLESVGSFNEIIPGHEDVLRVVPDLQVTK